MTVSDILYFFWYRWGYYYSVLSHPLYNQYLAAYQVLEDFIDEHPSESLPSFYQKLCQKIESNTNTAQRDQKGEIDSVSLLTIHAAKGLEFPFVFVVDMGSGTQRGHSSVGLIPHSIYGPLITLPSDQHPDIPHYITACLRQDHSKSEQEDAELRRLFYVALTRASQCLFLSGTFPPQRGHKKEDNSMPSTRTLLGLLLETLDIAGTQFLEDHPLYRLRMIEEYEQQLPQPFSARSVEDLDTMAPPSPAKIQRKERWSASSLNFHVNSHSKEDRATVASYVDDKHVPYGLWGEQGDEDKNIARDVGVICHRIIELCIAGRGGNLSVDHPAFTAVFQNISQKDSLSIFEQSHDLCQRLFASPWWHEIEKTNHKKAEVPFLMNLCYGENTFLIDGRIDLLVERENEVTIIDFKTDGHINSELYTIQMEIYRQAMEAYYAKKASIYLYYLRKEKSIVVAYQEDSKKRIKDFLLSEKTIMKRPIQS